jgi:hypothetical protein
MSRPAASLSASVTAGAYKARELAFGGFGWFVRALTVGARTFFNRACRFAQATG